MPAEHRLSLGVTGLYGKHPAFGDFIAAGVVDDALQPLGDWLQQSLGAWRASVGEDWQPHFDRTPQFAFWIGGALAGGFPLRGVWSPSRDRAGRRFPLLILQVGGPAPIADPSQDFYAMAGQALNDYLNSPRFEPRDAAERLQNVLPKPVDQPQPNWPTFWALNPSMTPQDLLAGLGAADHAHASAWRSYWWFTANEGAGTGLLACHGMPGPSELGWLFAGGVAQPEPAPQNDPVAAGSTGGSA
ncbi:type VI secretion system-associated protein TagF [Paracoccus caeni]|uniref:Type VI secretion system-associated protein TagF n=1 Tax=Paracoccus caeni TaxID=657651 RepID=A0A934VTQ1_9RHOB|nr:type VI secretion system-associated protein TagF [Paracoccus caeni]MBK4214966.1 type VI secretion system-associated protein TagF [Paracoccus caeni]